MVDIAKLNEKLRTRVDLESAINAIKLTHSERADVDAPTTTPQTTYYKGTDPVMSVSLRRYEDQIDLFHAFRESLILTSAIHTGMTVFYSFCMSVGEDTYVFGINVSTREGTSLLHFPYRFVEVAGENQKIGDVEWYTSEVVMPEFPAGLAEILQYSMVTHAQFTPDVCIKWLSSRGHDIRFYGDYSAEALKDYIHDYVPGDERV